MQCGCPVVASSATSIPEVAGDAALLVDPYDVEALAGAIHDVLTDDRIKNRLVKAGYEQAGTFSWERCGEIMLEKIRELRNVHSDVDHDERKRQ
jgi:glycosyltransferase involved in cell wall biosynthesis